MPVVRQLLGCLRYRCPSSAHLVEAISRRFVSADFCFASCDVVKMYPSMDVDPVVNTCLELFVAEGLPLPEV